MEKLERVLAAEENARLVVSRASDEAASIRAAATQEADTIASRVAAEAADSIERQRSEMLGAARAQADRINADAEREVAVALTTAAERMDAVVSRIAASLRG